jgi:ribosomal protein S18 acetylase RimI-like enzyme
VWLAPGAHPITLRREARLLRRWAVLARRHPRAVPRLLRASSALDALHPAEPHWFLSLLGTEPALQGRGLGGALLERGLERARGVPVHLDTDTERNVAWYRRFGFEVTAEVQVMHGAPQSWAMLARP